MDVRFKLAALAGLESMTKEEVAADLQNHIVDNVFDTHTELTPDESVVEQKVNEALAEATSDVKESSKLAETYLDQEEKRLIALSDLEEAVSGVESLFEGEFSHTAYNHLMRHADRCAKRAGVTLPIKLDGMESMSSASIYLETRNGLEGFMDSVKQGFKDTKAFFIKLYNMLIDMVRDKFNEVRSATKAYQIMLDEMKDYDGSIATEFTVAKWYESTQHRNEDRHHAQMATGVTESMLSAASKLDIKAFAQGELRDAEIAIRGPFQYSFKSSAIEVEKKDSITTGRFTLGKYLFDFGFKDFQPSTEEELKEFVTKTFFKVGTFTSNVPKLGSTLPAVFRSKQDIINLLEGNLAWCKFVDRFTKTYQNDLKRERDFVIAGLASKDGLTRDPRPLVRLKQKILSSMFKAHTDVMRADLSLVKAHLG